MNYNSTGHTLSNKFVHHYNFYAISETWILYIQNTIRMLFCFQTAASLWNETEGFRFYEFSSADICTLPAPFLLNTYWSEYLLCYNKLHTGAVYNSGGFAWKSVSCESNSATHLKAISSLCREKTVTSLLPVSHTGLLMCRRMSC